MTIPLDIPRIMQELNLDLPVYHVTTHGDCVELHLYGGKVVTWKPEKGDPLPVISDQEESAIENHGSTLMQTVPRQNSNKRKKEKRREKQ